MSLMAHDNLPLILCASARLAQGIRQSIQAHCRDQGHRQWQSPTVMPLQDWLDQTIEQALLCGQVALDQAPQGMLTPHQEAILWEQSIQHCLKQHEAAALFNTSGLASAAMEANRYLIEWNIRIDTQQASEETQQFMRWRQQFQMRCKQTGMLEPVRYQAWQLAQIAGLAITWTQPIQLAGFDRIHPHLQTLITQLQAQGAVVTHYVIDVAPTQVQRMGLPSAMDEIRAAVHWVQHTLATKPDARLAIVVPALDDQRAVLAHLLDDVLHPDTLHPLHSERPRCYEFSLGLPLKQWPLVRAALRLLRLAFAGATQPQTEFSALLDDVYCSHGFSEADARAALDAAMRQQCPMHLRMSAFIRFILRKQQDASPIVSPAFVEHMQALMQVVECTPRKQRPSEWAATFSQCLNAGQWPGERSISSHEFQCKQAFERLYGQLAGLDPWLDQMDAMQALHRLEQLCQAQIFQPKTVQTPNLTVMGMLEASAHPLDGVWVMGMNDHLWPPLARTNALIPAELQRHAATPNASSEVQLAFAAAIHARLIRSATQVMFSYALQEGDRVLRMSPLIQAIADTPPSTGARTLAETIATQAPTAWQWLDDAQAPPIQEGEHISGGTGLLRAQAICPAWAFYQYRLKARALDTPHNGLDAMQRGELIHQLLAAFWTQHPSIDLNTLAITQLNETLAQLAIEVITTFNHSIAHALSPIFCELEAERLAKLALTWLCEVERTRITPFNVQLIEASFKPIIEGIQVKLIIDRVDQLNDGRLVVMDYKTGRAPDFKNWASDRITEPQLPIYAAFVLQEAEIAAVVFGKVRLTDAGFAGIAAEEDIVPGIRAFHQEKNTLFDPVRFPTFAAIRAHWRTQITQTAQALKAGDAAVVFESEQALAYCDVLPLLRLPERQLQFERAQQADLT